jgi:hypothetical protein
LGFGKLTGAPDRWVDPDQFAKFILATRHDTEVEANPGIMHARKAIASCGRLAWCQTQLAGGLRVVGLLALAGVDIPVVVPGFMWAWCILWWVILELCPVEPEGVPCPGSLCA